jgi:diguanylate cyclase (GGDEF)-like protein/PAS domain S-box-containing protein
MRSLSKLIETKTRWLKAVAQGSTLLGLIMIALIWAGLSFHQEVRRDNDERGALQDADNLARAFEENLARSLNEIDRSLKIMRSRYVRNPDELEFRDWLRNSYLFDEQTLQVGIIGADGRLRLSSADTPSSPKTDLSDREHFRVHLESTSDDLFISKPVVGRTSGKWSIQLTRRIENPDGSFGGVVVASLDPMNLARFYSSVNIGNDGYVSVVGADGIVRASGGPVPPPLGLDLSRANLFKHYPKEATGWYYNASTLSDRIPRLVTFRAVKGYPLVVTVGLSETEIFSELRAEKHWYYLLAVALTLLILVIIGLSIRGRWLREKMAADLKVQNANLNRTRKFLDTISENVPVPIVVKEADTLKFVLVNHAYEAFTGLPRDQLIGKTVFDLFSSKDAQLITGFDHDAVRSNKRLILGDFQANTPRNGLRVVDTTRLVVSDESDKPGHLLVVIDDVTEKRKAEEKIAYLAHHDPLTGLLNRARFNERLDEALARVGRGGRLALLLIDLDRFKEVNDTHGHPVGDELLIIVADRLRGCVREIDVVARLGGDEFAIVQTAIEQPEDIAALAERIRTAIAAPFGLGDFQAVVDVSIGISLAPDDSMSTTELLKQADVALYRAKRDGRGVYRFFAPDMDAKVAAGRDMASDLGSASPRLLQSRPQSRTNVA